MKANLLSPDKDPMGAAITDYFHHQKAGKLRVFSSQFEEDEIPINQLFRSFNEMSEPEKTALPENETIASSGRMYLNGFERPALSFRG